MRYLLLQFITILRIPLSIGVAVILLNLDAENITVLITCAVMLGLCELTDLMDGILARRWSLQSEFGAMLDPYSDSVSRIIVYWTLACAGFTLMIVPLVLALRDVTVSYCRIYWSTQGKSVSARWSGKIKAVVQGTGAFILLFQSLYPESIRSHAVMATSWIVIGTTAYSGIDYLFASSKVKEKQIITKS